MANHNNETATAEPAVRPRGTRSLIGAGLAVVAVIAALALAWTASATLLLIFAGILLGATVNARAVAQQLLEAFRAADWLHGDAVPDIAVSIGVAAFPSGGSDAHSLLRSADAAMYLAKATGNGRGGVRVFGTSAAAALTMELLPPGLP